MLTKTEIEILVNEYPFLWPTHINGKKVENFNYSYCELSYLPEGWVRSFIPDFLSELKDILIKNDCLEKYFVVTAGVIDNHFNWRGNISLPEIYDLIKKYSKKVKKYCYYCGSPNVKYKSTWGPIECEFCALDDFEKSKKTVDYPINFEEEFELISNFS